MDASTLSHPRRTPHMTRDERKALYLHYQRAARAAAEAREATPGGVYLTASRSPNVQIVGGGAFVEVQMFIPAGRATP